jgi:PelA/Pel-15E family pectate lyase
MRFLARVYGGTRKDRFRQGFIEGFDFLLRAQYPSGGWPQFFPLRQNYSRYITFNDDAMTGVMELLRDAASGVPPLGFIDARRRSEAADAIERGLRIVLRSQVLSNGGPTAWCAQVDPVTLEPRGARSYEHPSLSGKESVRIVRYLMGIE